MDVMPRSITTSIQSREANGVTQSVDNEGNEYAKAPSNSGRGLNLAQVGTMTKKETKSKVGENSLLQTARTKNSLLSPKSKPDDYIENEFSRLRLNSGSSFDLARSKPYSSGSNFIGSGNHTGEKLNEVQSPSFFSLWPVSSGAVDTNQHEQQTPLKNKKFAKANTSGRKDLTSTNKKTMDISKGLRFSAPAPMTLNRYQPQMGQEKTAPESKEYLEMQTMMNQTQAQAKHMAEAKFTIEKRLKQAFGLEETDYHKNEKIKYFGNENRNALGNTSLKQKTMMKEILGKVRSKPLSKLQESQEKSSAIQAAMAAAAAAVEAATGNPSSQSPDRKRPMNEEEARAIVTQALSVSRQKKKMNSIHEMRMDDMFRPSTTDINRQKLATHKIDKPGREFDFPINEVTMDPNEDSVSELDASLRNMRKMPVLEIHMINSKKFHGDESISTLGTPRVFEQLDKLLQSEPYRFQQQPGLIRDFLEDNMGGSAAPPPMVTSYDARALIDQIDSGTLVGDMTAGTARAENAVQFCNIARNCFHPEHKPLFTDASARNRIFESSMGVPGEESLDDAETGSDKDTPSGELWASSNLAFTQAFDNAIRRAENQIVTKYAGHQTNDGPSSPSERVEKWRGKSEVLARTEPKSPSSQRRTGPTSLLEKDDAYWDTLSTIASTANEQSTESDAYIDEFVQPGPIPGEITTPSSEVKSATSPAGNGEGTFESNRHAEKGFLSRQEGKLHEIMNDVTDLIDSNLLDKIPISRTRRSNTTGSFNAKHLPDNIEGDKNSISLNPKTRTKVSNQMKPRPEAVNSSKLKEKRNGNLTTAASQIAKGIRSVSWGFEEIYEDKNQLDKSDEETSNSESSSYNNMRTSRPYPEGMHRNPRLATSLENAVEQQRADEDLLSKTLELSKGLLDTIMGSQVVQESKEPEDLHPDISSDNSSEMQYDRSRLDGNAFSVESRDDFHLDGQTRKAGFSPTINSRLESLRNQRTLALTKFRKSQMQMSMPQPDNVNGKAVAEWRDRERPVRFSSRRLDNSKNSREHNPPNLKKSFDEHRDINLNYTTSDSNASTTPSQKARNLRLELADAMRTSREIQLSQNQLGDELNLFKRRYYKNPEIQISEF